MTKLMWVYFNCPCVQTFSCLIAWYYTPTWNLKFQQLYESVIYTSSQSGNERWQLMSKLVQFTDVHFPDLNPTSYDNLNNMKLDLNVSTRSVNFSANNQMQKGCSFSL